MFDLYFKNIDQVKNFIKSFTRNFIEKRLKLRNPIYSETASYGHMGRNSKIVNKTFTSAEGKIKKIDVELFTWEKLDYVDEIKKKLNLK